MRLVAPIVNRGVKTPVPNMPMYYDRYERVLELCRGKKVLHLGCVDEERVERALENQSLMHLRIFNVAKELWGVDIGEQGLKVLKQFGFENLICGDIENLESINELRLQHFDVIVLPEVLEHLNNPGMFFQNAVGLFDSQTIMVITVPNAYRLTGLSYLLRGIEHVNPDHNFWFSYSTLLTILGKNNYRMLDSAIYSYVGKGSRLSIALLRQIIKLVVFGQRSATLAQIVEILARQNLLRDKATFADGFTITTCPISTLREDLVKSYAD